ncbi:MAG: LysM peptidoglycan-binding domain-containing protein, partial [Acidobacteriota bacterium]
TGGNAGAAVNTVQRYTVTRGDSPYLIAQRYDVDLDALLTANGLTRRSSIYPGDRLLIPSGGAMPSVTSYTVRRGDTLGTIAERHGVSLRSLLQANNMSSRSVIYPGDTLRIPGRN